ncbi:MAG: hypothetical protein R3F59_33565, partial [Myxococcota bacterium]
WLAHRYTHDPQRPPKAYDEILTTVDATFKALKGSDYVSIQTWGRYGWTKYHLLDRVHGRMSDVKTRQALRDAHTKRPHAMLVEEKANGAALTDDLRGEIPAVVAFTPYTYGDRLSRASSPRRCGRRAASRYRRMHRGWATSSRSTRRSHSGHTTTTWTPAPNCSRGGASAAASATTTRSLRRWRGCLGGGFIVRIRAQPAQHRIHD